MTWGRAINWGLLGGAALLLSACYTRPPNTDIFGRNLPPTGDSGGGTTIANDRLPPDVVLTPPPATSNWSPTPVATDARAVTARAYIVQPGDTLRGIGNRTGAGSEAIARENALTAPYIIRVGQSLNIPGGRYHEVRSGQTGIAIARAYGVAWADMVRLNQLSEPFVLRVGQRLRLPDGGVGNGARSVEEQARAFTLDIDDIMTGGEPAVAQNAPLPGPATAAAPSRWLWPNSNGTLLRRFGAASGGRVNQGIDIALPIGSAVHASAPGVVAYAGSEIGVLGGLILIDHGGGWVSAYAHLDRVAVARGAQVSAGQAIATSGASGGAAQPQLHFELRQNRQPVDPMLHLPAR